MHGWSENGHMNWMSWAGSTSIWWILAAAFIAVVVWMLLRSKHGSKKVRRDSPEETLKRRYARGEIDQETFQRTRTDLKG